MTEMTEGTQEELLQEDNRDLKPLMVHYKGSRKKYEFKFGIVSGVLNDGSTDEISTIISGFETVENFITIYNNIILQAYDFLKGNADNSDEEVLLALRTTTDSIFDGIETGAFDEYFSSITEQK
jgi:hypothetical protein